MYFIILFFFKFWVVLVDALRRITTNKFYRGKWKSTDILYTKLYINYFVYTGSFSVEELLWYTERKILGATYLERSMQYSKFVRTIIDERYTNTHLLTELVIMREKIITNSSSLASVTAGILWFNNMTQYINILKDIQDGLAQVR